MARRHRDLYIMSIICTLILNYILRNLKDLSEEHNGRVLHDINIMRAVYEAWKDVMGGCANNDLNVCVIIFILLLG